MARKKKTLNRNSSVKKAADDVMRERSRGAMGAFLDFIVERRKIIMPVALIFCVALTVVIALLFNRPSRGGAEANTPIEGEDVSGEPLEVCSNPQIIELINRYYAAYAGGDVETMEQITVGMTETDKLTVQEFSRYVESYAVEEIYDKVGPVADSYIVYTTEKMKFYDHPTPVPGMQSYFVRRNADGEGYYIQVGEVEDTVNQYLGMSHLSDDVIDLNNRVNAEYNELMDSDKELADLVSAIKIAISDTVAELLAEQQNEIANANGAETPTPQSGDRYLRATQVVNIRAEASTDAEMVGTTSVGDVYKIVADNGDWTIIEYDGGEAYVWTEYFEVVTSADAVRANNAKLDAGKHVMNTTCNIRAEASTDSDVVGQAVEGHDVTVVESYDNGWSKVAYDDVDGYIRTEYINE